MEDYDLPESKFGKIYKVAGPRKYFHTTFFLYSQALVIDHMF